MAQPKTNGGRPPSLRQLAYREIKQRVLDGSYAPGSLLSESQLAEELGISRTPVREALRDLAGGALVRILPQRGIIVSELSVKDITEIYQLREQLECFAVRLAAENVTNEGGAQFLADHRQAVQYLNAGRLRPAYDAAVKMHVRLIAMALNARLSRIMDQLADEAHRYGLLTLRSGHAQQAIDDHGRIIDALLARDGERAAELMRQHLRADRDLALRAALPAGVSATTISSVPTLRVVSERP
jgi:GntR family transcriptional regulator, rspAB operon transcriptional repressor